MYPYERNELLAVPVLGGNGRAARKQGHAAQAQVVGLLESP